MCMVCRCCTNWRTHHRAGETWRPRTGTRSMTLVSSNNHVHNVWQHMSFLKLLWCFFRSTPPSWPCKASLNKRSYGRLSTENFSDFNQICDIDRDQWVIQDGMLYDPIHREDHRGQKVAKVLVYLLCWYACYQKTNNEFDTPTQYLIFFWTDFWYSSTFGVTTFKLRMVHFGKRFLLKSCDLYETWYVQCESKKSPLCGFFDIFSQMDGNFFAHVLYVHFYTRVQIFIQLSPTLTKLCHTKCDHLTNFYISLEV